MLMVCVAVRVSARDPAKGPVLVVSDVTEAGRAVQSAEPRNPVYYVSLSGGFQALGGRVAGDRVPPAEETERILRAALREQGYLLAGPDTPAPSLFIFYMWGTIDPDEFSPDPDDSGSSMTFNQGQLQGFVGVHKVLDLPEVSAMRGRVLDASREGQFFIGVAAYDLASMIKRDRKLLWTTKISMAAMLYNLPDAFPTMLVSGAPFFGRENDRPVWVGPRDRHATVEVGEVTVQEYEDAPEIKQPEAQP